MTKLMNFYGGCPFDKKLGPGIGYDVLITKLTNLLEPYFRLGNRTKVPSKKSSLSLRFHWLISTSLT